MIPTVAVDIGTTRVKLGLFDAAGASIAAEAQPTPTIADDHGEVYDVDALLALVTDFIARLDPGSRALIGSIAITGVGESGGLVRADGSLASPMILWHDQRGAPYLDRLDAAARSRVYEVTGLPVNANYGLSKIAWALDHATDADDALWLNVADCIATRLTGERWAEVSLASRTLAFDLTERGWSAEIAGLLDVDVEVFPRTQPQSGSPVLPAVAAQLGIGPATRVIVAGHDHMVGGIGAGLAPGELLNSTGTTEGLLMLRETPLLDRSAEEAKLANGIAPGGEGVTLFASIPTGGAAFAALQSMLTMDPSALESRIDDLDRRYRLGEIDLDSVPVVLPRFRGSPPPDKNPAALGVVAGLSATTTADDIIVGTFLGMALQFRDVLELFPERPRRIKVIGPASRNPLWLALKADLLGVPLSVARTDEIVSRGAQALASGVTPDWATADPFAVAADAARHARLVAWADDRAPMWAAMKAVSG